MRRLTAPYGVQLTYLEGAPMTVLCDTEDEASVLLETVEAALASGTPGETIVPGHGPLDLTRVTAAALVTTDAA